MAHYDTLVLGGGVAGLSAAFSLSAAGQRVALLEAKEQLGGRVLSHLDPSLPVPVELGAEFIHGRTAASSSLLSKAGIVSVDASEEQWFYQGGTWHSSDTFDLSTERLFDGLGAEGSKDMSFETLLKSAHEMGVDTHTTAYARMLVEGFDAADPKEVSSLALAREWQGGSTVGGTQFRPLGAYQNLLSTLQKSLGLNVEILTGTVVRSVTWGGQGVGVTSDRFGQEFTLKGKRAVVTLPVSLLQAGTVHFEPALGKEEALRGLAMGPVVKLIMLFDESFWEKVEGGRLQNAAFFHDPAGAFPTFWTALPLRLPYLTAWAGGPKATALSGYKKGELTQWALLGLERMFGTVPRPHKVFFHDWQADPFARGAYSYVRVGGLSSRRKLAESKEGVLFFAGEATNYEGEDGTVYGALQSGERAAREILGMDNE